MSEFDPHISIDEKEIIKAKDCDYIIKKIIIEHLNLKIRTPFKVLEGREINEEDVNIFIKNLEKPIFESGKYVLRYKSWKKLHYLLDEAEEDRVSGLNKFLGIRRNFWDLKYTLTTVSIVFARNPFVENKFVSGNEVKKLPPLDKESYHVLLDHVHAASKALILVPDIRIRGNETIKLDDYLKFVDESVKILSKNNKKPIFVPIQIHLSQKRLKKILKHYKRQGYLNIWVNFNASHLGGTYFSRVRTLLRLIDNIMDLTEVTLYFSHIKKEINPHIKDEKTIASDVLSQFFAAGFIGVNREPPRVIEDPEERIMKYIMRGEFKSEDEYKEALRLHKSRIFDPESYYYYRIDKYPHELPYRKDILLKRDKLNRLVNSIIIHREVERTKNIVEEQKIIKPYLKNKEAFKENNYILDEIIKEKSKTNTKQQDLYDILGKL